MEKEGSPKCKGFASLSDAHFWIQTNPILIGWVRFVCQDCGVEVQAKIK